ncbi:MAG: HEPN domain-containing protein [Candidatus Jordarchaeaceae archaeon]
MNTEDMAKAYFRDSEFSLREAKTALKQGLNHRAIRRAQESVELAIKAILRLIGRDYPKKHEVGSLLEVALQNLDPPQEILDALPEIKRISLNLALKRGPAFYGDEATLKTPEQLYTKKDAEEAIGYAEYTLKICRKIYAWWEKSKKS